jgi:hypothetical protein
MQQEDLYQRVLSDLNIENIHPLHKAILEECCENALNSKNANEELSTLLLAVQVAFITANSALKGLIIGSLKANQAEQATLNYRNQEFIIKSDSKLLS